MQNEETSGGPIRNWKKAVIPLPPALLARLQQLCADADLSLSQGIRDVLATDMAAAYLTGRARAARGGKSSAA